VLWNLMLDLQRAGFEPDLETLKIAVEESGLLERADVYFLENYFEYQDRWDALWVATPGDGKHKQVVKVCRDGSGRIGPRRGRQLDAATVSSTHGQRPCELT
jgi:hypothetical protein